MFCLRVLLEYKQFQNGYLISTTYFCKLFFEVVAITQLTNMKWKKYKQTVQTLCPILIKITQCHCLDRAFLQNRTTDFDETLHVAWVCLPKGFGNSGRSGYSPVQKKGGLCEF